VRRLDEGVLAKRADRASMSIRTQDVDAEPLLVQPNPDLEQPLAPDLRCRDRSLRAHVGGWQADLQQDCSACGVVVRHEHRCHDDVLAGRDAMQIDERHLIRVRRPQRSVVGLVDRTRPASSSSSYGAGLPGFGAAVVSVNAAAPRISFRRWMPVYSEPKLMRASRYVNPRAGRRAGPDRRIEP
jgi:hypothetical protein